MFKLVARMPKFFVALLIMLAKLFSDLAKFVDTSVKFFRVY